MTQRPYGVTLMSLIMNEIQKLHEKFCNYSEALKDNTPRTIRWFREVFSYFTKQTSVRTPQDITADVIEEWIIMGKMKKGWSAKTRRTRLQAMKSFCEWLVLKNYLQENPLDYIALPSLPKRIPEYLTKEQAKELLQCTEYYDFDYHFERKRALAIIATFLFTGIRRQELIDLKYNEVDLANRVIFVRNGKGKKDRIVTFCPRLKMILHDYQKDRERLRKSCSNFFTSLRYNTKMGDKVIPRLCKKIKKASEIPCNPHLLRHTYAVLMLQGGCDIFHLSELMGHSDIKTTTIYLNAAVNHLQKQTGRHPLNDC